MKIIKNKFFICILLLLSGVNGYSQDPPVPCLDECGNPYDCDLPGPPPCEAAPINENIFMLLCIALLFGIYVIYKYQQNKKTAV